MLAIRKETQGETIDQTAICPKCYEKQIAIIDKYYKKLLEDEKIDINTLNEEKYNKLVEQAKELAKTEIATAENNGEFITNIFGYF